MNKIQYLTLIIFIFSSSILNNLQSQCVVCIEAPPLVTCGESATLLGEGYITSTYSDDFNNWNNPTSPSALWANISNGGTTNSNCTSSPTNTSSCAGAASGGDFLWFPQGSTVPRVARTVQMAVPAGGTAGALIGCQVDGG